MRNTALRFCLTGLLIAAIVTGAAEAIFAYEEDVHYGLTYWLATKAGFSWEQAKSIAQGDVSADQGKYRPAPWAVALHIILDGDPEASEAVRDLHFPSFVRLPAHPDERKVEPNSSAARHLALKEIAYVDPHIPEGVALEEFGRSLHPLQDSWSHQGVPDIPFRPGLQLRPDLSWGHPKDRGGWWSHDADITCRHDPSETLAVAKATFELMLEFRRTHKIRASQTPSKWEDLVPRVNAFAQACTKQAKLQWFQSEAPDFGGWDIVLKPISVPGHLGGPLFHFSGPFHASQHGPRDLSETFTGFLTSWLVGRDIPAALQFVSIGDVANQLPDLKGTPARQNEASLWVQKFLTLWLIEDHGLVNKLGHGMPTADGYAKLPASTQGLPDEFRLVRYERLQDALQVPEGPSMYDVEPFSIVELSPELLVASGFGQQEAPVYAVVFSLQDLPHDTLVMLAQRKADSWRITGMYWVVL